MAVTFLYRLMRLGLTHDSGNEIFGPPVAELLKHMGSIAKDEGGFRFVVHEGDIYINGGRVKQDVTNFHACDYVARRIADKGLGGFVANKPCGDEDLKRFVIALSRFDPNKGDDGDAAAAFEKALDTAGVDGFTPLGPHERAADDQTVDIERLKDLRERSVFLYERTLSFIREALSDQAHQTVDIRQAKRLVHQLVDLSAQDAEHFSLSGLSAIKNYDEYTYNHSVNVCVLAITFGQKLGMPRNRLAELGLGALFHDLGKLSIPKHILNKPAALSDDEWEMMRRHPLFALKLLFNLHDFSEAGVKKVLVALEHHMNFDLSGYPRLVLEKKMHLYSRIVAIVDSFDAMTTKRAYQKAMRPDEALKKMLTFSGKRYDPVLLKAFVMSVGLYPAGTLALLNNGEIGVVLKPNTHAELLERPWVRVVANISGGDVQERVLNLGEDQHRMLWIVKSLDPEDYNVNIPHYLLYT
ncbi:MAG: HD-GYP domain-containing protein [Deltaproteobacteria bacterium]|nr:HD-GYP domain-containing protein [Deltaproteobacteria bacterium]